VNINHKSVQGRLLIKGVLICLLAVCWAPAYAKTSSRLLITGGAATLEGTAGGGIVPMAVIAGYGAQEEWGATVFMSQVNTRDFQLNVKGASWGWRNRLELSIAEQNLAHPSLTRALALPSESIEQQVVGVKLRLLGDLIYTSLPQLSLGWQYKQNKDFLVPNAVGAKQDSGSDVNLTASKLVLAGFLGRNLLLNGNLRYTNANQLGLVGFGGDEAHAKSLQAEVSAGVLLNSEWIIGTEYRQKPNNLSALTENDWRSYFIGWFPVKSVSLVAAYVDLGSLATFDNQTGWYLSLQGSY
jgi:hypothetical protein